MTFNMFLMTEGGNKNLWGWMDRLVNGWAKTGMIGLMVGGKGSLEE